jgi:creatinine amidohydrolase
VPDVYTGIWWYASYPNHYAGEGDKATRELGELVTEGRLTQLVNALRAVKADTQAPAMQKEFFDRVLMPK